MKNFIVLFFILALIASCKKNGVDATLFRNCTGTYLKIEGKEYRVCNHDKLGKYTDGVTIKVNYKHIKECNSNQVVCMMDYAHEGHIKVSYAF